MATTAPKQPFLQQLFDWILSRPIWVEGALVALFPCLPLFCFSQIQDHNDWYNHSWVMGFTGSYLRSHFSYPETMSANQLIGFPISIFYGYGFYSLVGIFSAFFNPQAGVLVMAYVLLWLQYGAVGLLLTRLDLPRWFASCAAIMTTFCIYALTNLYNRNAITEFFANVALTIGFAALLLSIVCEGQLRKRYWYLLSLLMFGLMATSHPITLRISAEFTVLFCLLLLWIGKGRRMEMLVRMAGVPLVTFLLIAHWLYAFFAIHGDLGIIGEWLLVFPDDIDALTSRLSPILFDRRFWEEPFKNIAQISTPFLDAPANIFTLSMALLLLGCAARQRVRFGRLKVFFTVISLCWLLFLWCSMSEFPYGRVVPQGYSICQYAYRMVNMLNLSAIALLLGTAFCLKLQGSAIVFPQWSKTLAAVLLTAACFAFVQKMVHVSTMLRPREQHVLVTPDDVKNRLNLPPDFYGVDSYKTIAYYYQRPPQRPALEGLGTFFTVKSDPFGDVDPIHVMIYQNDWFRTNVYVFAWNKIMVDGHQAEREVYPLDSLTFNIRLSPGRHTLEYVLDPPVFWRSLRILSLGTYIMLLALWCTTTLRGFLLSRKQGAGLA